MVRLVDGGERLHKRLAGLGLGSRRVIEGWIEQGRIKVNGKVAQLGDKVTSSSRITVNGRALRGMDCAVAVRVILYHKPEGEISTRVDPQGRPTVFRRLPKLKGQRWVSVGRLDINTRGVLLFTNDGELANRLMHPRAGIEREYMCRVYGEVGEVALRRVQEGIVIDGRVMRFVRVQRQRGGQRNVWYSVVVQEGRYREIRRLWEAVGCQLSRLIRVRYGEVRLPRGLAPGGWRELTPAVVGRLLVVGEEEVGAVNKVGKPGKVGKSGVTLKRGVAGRKVGETGGRGMAEERRGGR